MDGKSKIISKLEGIEMTVEYFSLMHAQAASFIAWRQELQAYNDILILLFNAQHIQEEAMVETPSGYFFYHKDGLVYEHHIYHDEKMPYGDLAIAREGLTTDLALMDLYTYLSGGTNPPDFGSCLMEKRYSVILVDNKRR